MLVQANQNYDPLVTSSLEALKTYGTGVVSEITGCLIHNKGIPPSISYQVLISFLFCNCLDMQVPKALTVFWRNQQM